MTANSGIFVGFGVGSDVAGARSKKYTRPKAHASSTATEPSIAKIREGDMFEDLHRPGPQGLARNGAWLDL